MSVKCWAFAPAEDIAPGARGEDPTLTKPTDPTRKRRDGSTRARRMFACDSKREEDEDARRG